MKSVNQVTLIGHLGKAPDLWETQAGVPVCNFSLATNEVFTQGDKKEERTTWHAIIAWQTGYFEGTAVFRTPDPGEVKVSGAGKEEHTRDAVEQLADSAELDVGKPAEDEARSDDPNKAGIRVDLSGIGAE